LIPPGVLIPAAESNGDIVALGEWILIEGCRQATKWPSSIQLAVNCSIVQLRQGTASRSAQLALEESGLPVDRLTIEATEKALADGAAANDLRAVVDLGIQVAVDDVGTSWSSFDLLQQLNVNTLKIDRSFVSGLEVHEGINRMVVETVVRLAHDSGMSTIAEGVETAVHCAVVREFESDAAQGYYFSPPLSPEAATELANREDLVFPLDGPGWYDGGASPVDGLVEETLRGPVHAAPVVDDGIESVDGEEPATSNGNGAARRGRPAPAKAAAAKPAKAGGAGKPEAAAGAESPVKAGPPRSGGARSAADEANGKGPSGTDVAKPAKPRARPAEKNQGT
jgi:EAL domain-containing protein (putative c-di-GMP-specific phosphodiesterase class I)